MARSLLPPRTAEVQVSGTLTRKAPPQISGLLTPLNSTTRKATHWLVTCPLKPGHSTQGTSSAGICLAGHWEPTPTSLALYPLLGGLVISPSVSAGSEATQNTGGLTVVESTVHGRQTWSHYLFARCLTVYKLPCCSSLPSAFTSVNRQRQARIAG